MSKGIKRRECVLCGNIRRTTQKSEEPYTCGKCESKVTRRFLIAKNGNYQIVMGVRMMNNQEFNAKYIKKPWWAFWR